MSHEIREQGAHELKKGELLKPWGLGRAALFSGLASLGAGVSVFDNDLMSNNIRGVDVRGSLKGLNYRPSMPRWPQAVKDDPAMQHRLEIAYQSRLAMEIAQKSDNDRKNRETIKTLAGDVRVWILKNNRIGGRTLADIKDDERDAAEKE